MRTLQDLVRDSHGEVFVLQLLVIDDGLKQELFSWFRDQDLTLEPMVNDISQYYHVDFVDRMDPRFLEWMSRWEKEDGSSISPDAYRMIMVEVRD